ncbi:cysteine-rich receptor-like protein kinase 19 isoform X1 [Typha latifolia]|uniref:cysteine-rich receptor-like protein kinase 19 isoform X1 n=1 Tax=Typha latifolia TaxID=4733 RepID=UPI003C2C33A2
MYYHQYHFLYPKPTTTATQTANQSPTRVGKFTSTSSILTIDGSDRPSYCGHPDFHLTCINNNSTLLISINGLSYQVTHVDVARRALTLVAVLFVGQECPQPIYDTTFASSDFQYTDDDVNLTVYFNCTEKPTSASMLYTIECLSEVVPHPSYYALYEGGDSDAGDKCSSVTEVPINRTVAEKLMKSNSSFGDALREGFELRWIIGSGWCGACIESGGVCGYNASSPRNPTCFCRYGSFGGSCPAGDQSEGSTGKSKKGTLIGRKKRLFIIVTAASLTIFIIFVLLCLQWNRRRRIGNKKLFSQQPLANNLWENEERGSEFLVFDFLTIANATNNFSAENKLGQGGFGPVYKGQLPDGQEIAVKRLARNSGQGLLEFKNEILVIANLQHINLVKLLGYSVQGEEKILIYEFMPNKSLDFFLFDQTQGALLDWPKRLHIIEGVAQGLLYLHKHSRLKIIHRDLKASNILLDGCMNSKISDFGLARIFCTNEDQGIFTNKVAGTFGYISPEYAADGRFSVKSDVFSFGVLLLEIVSGKRNAGVNQYGDFPNLLGYAWEVWKEGRWLELVDPLLGDGYSMDEMMQCIHVALLCVQEKPGDRPTMSGVATMLGSESSMALPDPKQPGFFNLRGRAEADESSDIDETCSVNRVTLTDPMVR